MHASRRHVVSIAALAIATAAGPALATGIDFSPVFSETGHSMWTTGQAFAFDTGTKRIGPDPWNIGKVVGGFINPCNPFGTCNTGAQVGAETTGNFALEYGVKFNSGSVDVTYPINVHLNAPSAGSTNANHPFNITSSYNVAGFGSGPGNTHVLQAIGQPALIAQLQAHSPDIQAFVDLKAQFHAFIGAQACVVGVCQGPFLGPIDVDKSQTLAAINRNDDHKVRVGDTVINLDQNFSALDGDVTARLNLPSLNAISTIGAGSTATKLVSISRSNIAALDANVGNLISKAIGLPLVGNIGGIGYNLLSVNAGLALDVQQTLTLNLTPMMTLNFLSPVQRELAPGVWSPFTQSITYALGTDITLRSPYRSIGVIPISSLAATLTNRTDLLLTGDLSVQALGVNAFGLSLGPLLDTGNLHAGLFDIPIYTNSFSLGFDSVTSQPFNLTQLAPGASASFNGTSISYVNGGNGQGSSITSLNLHCPAFLIAQGLCNDSAGQTSLSYFGASGHPVFAANPGVFTIPHVNTTPNSDDPTETAYLNGTGYDPTIQPFVVPDGAPPIQGTPGVPEPASWALLIAGFGLAGAAMRIRRSGNRGTAL